jgi:hypothetical protein
LEYNILKVKKYFGKDIQMRKKFIILMVIVAMMLGFFGLTACEEVSLDEYKASTSTQLQDYADAKGQDNYTVKGWEVIVRAAEDGKKAIGDASTKIAIKEAFNNAKDVIDAVEPKENEVNNPISIHFFTTENWIHWQDHKYYDFANMTYSTKRILVEFYEGNPIPVSDEEYMIVSTFTEQQQSTFFDSIRESGIFDLDEYYHDIAEDGDRWNLIITFNDGTVFESNGYVKYPPQKDALDEAFLALTGYKLFTPLWEDNQ